MNDRYRTDLFVQHLYKDQPGKLRFDPEKIRTREDFESWKEQVREKAYELMQFPEDAYEEAKVHFLYSRQRDGYRVEKIRDQPGTRALGAFPSAGAGQRERRKESPGRSLLFRAGMFQKRCFAEKNP